jgi:hypothetical protein
VIEFFQTFAVMSLGWVALEAFLIAHGSHAERRERRRIERLISRKYPPTY